MPDGELRDPLQKRQQVKAVKQAAGGSIPAVRQRPVRPSAQTIREMIAPSHAERTMGPPNTVPNVAQAIRDRKGPLLLAKEHARRAPGGIDKGEPQTSLRDRLTARNVARSI